MPQDFALAAQVAYLRWLASEDAAEEQLTRTLRDYAGGQQPVYLTDRQKEFIGLKAPGRACLYAHNLCKLVIDVLAERLSVEGFEPVKGKGQSTEGTTGPVTLADWAAEWWEGNRADALQDEVHEAVLRDAESYIIVDWDAVEERPRWSLNLKTDGTQGVRVYRDPNTNAIRFASKRWQVYDPIDTANNGRTRVNLYYPDRVEKYISAKGSNDGIAGTGWEPYRDLETEPWPVPWVDSQGKPLGCAVIEFANPGGSEIEALLPLQDMLNKSDLDLIACTDSAGFRILYVTGASAKIGADGKPEKIALSPGRLIELPANAVVGAIEPTDPRLLIESCKYWIESIAGVSRTPQYLFQPPGGTPPSGESLKQQETGLVHKAERRQRVFGNAWEDVIYLSARLHNLYRPGDAVTIERVSAKWRSAKEFVDPLGEDKQRAETRQTNANAALLEQQVGVSRDTLVKSLGYDPEIERAQREAGSAELGDQLLSAFERGQ